MGSGVLSIPPFFGSPVSGEERFSRKEFELQIDATIKHGSGAMFFGLRRIGKSTEVIACGERLAEGGMTELFIDAEGLESEAEIFIKILQQLPLNGWNDKVLKTITADNSIAKTVRDALRQLTRDSIGHIEAYFPQISSAIEKTIKEIRSENPGISTVVIIDEFPWLCRTILEKDPSNGRSRVNGLLASLRRWRTSGMRMILTGSIGLIGLARQHNLDRSLLNDLQELALPPLREDEAQIFVAALVNGSGVSEWTTEHTTNLLNECVALYPSIIQIAFLKLSLGNKACDLRLIKSIFAEKIRPEFDAAFHNQFDRRSQNYKNLPTPMPTLLMEILKGVLNSKEPINRILLYEGLQGEVGEEEFGESLDILRQDGFIAVSSQLDGTQHWYPASKLVNTWWLQRRGVRK